MHGGTIRSSHQPQHYCQTAWQAFCPDLGRLLMEKAHCDCSSLTCRRHHLDSSLTLHLSAAHPLAPLAALHDARHEVGHTNLHSNSGLSQSIGCR
jgi:hypothetical protein